MEYGTSELDASVCALLPLLFVPGIAYVPAYVPLGIVYLGEDDIYHMLITTRNNGSGVIQEYTSSDLKNWSYSKIFFRNDFIFSAFFKSISLLVR